MSRRGGLQQEEQALGAWPRRLLHVPTMTSHEWQPGNIYGNATAPEYNAITYTWGRWRLKDHEQPTVQAIKVGGIPWRVPRVNPSHFTASQLELAIRRTTGGISKLANWREKSLPPVEFVWLDVACIDQRDNEPRSAAEVGRQAMIFDGAKDIVAWLANTSDLDSLLRDLDSLTVSVSALVESEDGFRSASAQAILGRIRDCFRELLKDPWFSSLWTLQEAYLRMDLAVMGRNAALAVEPREPSAPLPASGIPLHADLRTILGCCEILIDDTVRQAKPPAPYDEIIQMINRSGLWALSTTSALATYTATSTRTCGKDEDRIYGIQQIFGARVGTSAAVGSLMGSSLTRSQLEIQLGSHLLRHYPILSQMHTFTEPAPFGLAWLVSPKSAVPPHLIGSLATSGTRQQYDGNEEKACCKLSVKQLGPNTWARFKGRTCDLSEFKDRCVEFKKSDLLGETLTGRSYLNIYVDVTSELASCPEEYRGYDLTAAPSGERQEQLTRWLLQSFPEKLIVLLLGTRTTTYGDGATAMVGLLLLYCQTAQLTYYHRIGICWWDVSITMVGGKYLPQGRFLNGKGSPWKKSEGIFG